MKKFKLLPIILLLPLFFSACSSKSQTDVIDSNTKDISGLLKTLIQKEKEINKLNEKLEDCKESKTAQ
jgi:thioredoxin-related protein